MEGSAAQGQEQKQGGLNLLNVFLQGIEAYEAKGLHKKYEDQDRLEKSQYSLYEDLVIMLAFAQQKSNDKSNLFNLLSQGRLKHRTAESIRGRYKNYIKNIRSSDTKAILKYIIEKKSIEGYIVIDKNTFDLVVQENLKRPQRAADQVDASAASNSNEQSSKTTLRQKALARKAEEQSGDVFENFAGRKIQKTNGQSQKEQQSREREASAVEAMLLQQQQQQQQQQQVQVPVIQQADLKDARELDFYMTFLANYENVQKKSLIHVFDKLSGDLNLLVEYLSSHNQNLLWKEDEDRMLQSFETQTPQSIFLLKSIKKGKANIVRRAEYLGISLPDFE